MNKLMMALGAIAIAVSAPAAVNANEVTSGDAGDWASPISNVVVMVKTVAVGSVDLTVEVTFTEEVAPSGKELSSWVASCFMVKSSADLATLDEVEAEAPKGVGPAKLSKDKKTVTVMLGVGKPSEAAGFFRVIVRDTTAAK